MFRVFSRMAYLDNNATTKLSDAAKKITVKWLSACANPSGSNQIATKAKKLIDKTREYVRTLCNAKDYDVIFTSGATESNCLVIKSIVDSWIKNVKSIPHIITSALEHKSVLECLQQLEELKRVDVTILQPTPTGQISPLDVEAALRSTTALVTIMAANNETGVMNPISRIATMCHKCKVPFHSDCVQLFGKIRLDLPKLGIDAISVSMHKLYGPMGVGLLILKQSVIKGYKLQSQIAGTQQGGLRGGTENVPGIISSLAAMMHNFTNRQVKNSRLEKMKMTIVDLLREHYTLLTGISLASLETPETGKEEAVVVIGLAPDHKMTLPNTLLLSYLNYNAEVCNVKMKACLEKRGFIVSIGSACNTSSAKASHVLTALKAPPVVRRGTLRISLGDGNTLAQCRKFVSAFVEMTSKNDIWK